MRLKHDLVFFELAVYSVTICFSTCSRQPVKTGAPDIPEHLFLLISGSAVLPPSNHNLRQILSAAVTDFPNRWDY